MGRRLHLRPERLCLNAGARRATSVHETTRMWPSGTSRGSNRDRPRTESVDAGSRIRREPSRRQARAGQEVGLSRVTFLGDPLPQIDPAGTSSRGSGLGERAAPRSPHHRPHRSRGAGAMDRSRVRTWRRANRHPHRRAVAPSRSRARRASPPSSCQHPTTRRPGEDPSAWAIRRA